MPRTTDSVEFSEIQKAILETALRNPGLSNAEIAEQAGARITLVRDTRANYEDEVELAEDAEEAESTASTVGDDTDLSDAEAAILELARDNPGMSNAEIADETGARITLVRDTRADHDEEFDPLAADSADESADSEPSETEDAEPTAVQEAILDLAADNPEMTNSEIAAETGARITLVRDTRSQFGGDDGSSDSSSTSTADSSSTSAEFDTDAFSPTQIEILEVATANPDLTNGEIAAQTGTRITLVRDTIREHESDDAVDEGTADSEDSSDALDGVDTDGFSETQLEILETALANPELTNGEIAAQTDTRITLVRDTIHEHEYDEKPWVGNVEDDAEEDDEDDDSESTSVNSAEEEIEMPETTDSELLSDAEQAILEAALDNPDLTNGEIAAQTGTRITLVRDTRSAYEEAVDRPDDSEESDDTESSGSEATGNPTDRQREILAAVEANPDATNAEIADQTGARITFVRDTRIAYEGEVDLDGADDTETEATADDPETEATADAETGGSNAGPIIALVIGLVLAIVVAASIGVI